MSTAIANREEALEQVLIQGNLAQLSPAERLTYYKRVCESLGLNPLTKPFEYITLNGKLVLYARKDCTDQLRARDEVSAKIVGRELVEGVYVVTAQASFANGRTDESIGAVNVEGLKGEARANAMMKAETKAKRRVTLSICGLGMLDETEVETVPGARVVQIDPEPPKQIESKSEPAKQELARERESAKPLIAQQTSVASKAIAMLKDNYAAALEYARHHWNNFTESEKTKFLRVKAECSEKSPNGTPPDRNSIFPAMAACAKATGTPFDKLMQELSDEFGVGSLDDISPAQIPHVLDWLAGRMPKEKVA